MCSIIKYNFLSAHSLVKDLEMTCFNFTGFGKNFIKSQKISPDSFIQMAIQLAFYRYLVNYLRTNSFVLMHSNLLHDWFYICFPCHIYWIGAQYIIYNTLYNTTAHYYDILCVFRFCVLPLG